MSHLKPYHRNVRGHEPSSYSGYSELAYIEDAKYALSPQNYTRALLLIINDLRSIFEFVEPSHESCRAFSFRIHALLIRVCIEIEANFKAIFEENFLTVHKNRPLTIRDYRKIDVTHHLSSYKVILPMWNGEPPEICPFEPWLPYRGKSVNQTITLPWYRAYNHSKHSRHAEFKQANLWNLIQAVAALLIVVSSQFKNIDFEPGVDVITTNLSRYYPYQASIGSLFQIRYPDDWEDNERYNFDWSTLKHEIDRFDKINYDIIMI